MSCNLLLVEDDPLSRRNLTLFLQQSEHNVFQAETGEVALQLMSRVEFDVIVSDLRLPGRINGIDILKQHAAAAPGKRLVLLTAFGSDEVRAEAEAVGAIYREKPIGLNDLLDAVEAKP
jgi:DNA-binding response OmpR family regulator